MTIFPTTGEYFPISPSEQKTCVLRVDEVYVKCLLQYRGGEVFGQATNDPNKLANTILSYD